MAAYVTAHFYNPAAGRDGELSAFFNERHVPALVKLRGFREVQRFELSPDQIMAAIAQPWRYLSLYEFDFETPEIDQPALSPLLADMRDAGLIAKDNAERIHSYKMYGPWKYSRNHRPGPLTHIMLLLANCVPGREAEYHQWYDDIHSVEVSESDGYVGMRRGGLSPVQVAPYNYCPGDQLILGGLQTDDLAHAMDDFKARAAGTSKSGVAWAPRSTSASVARTVHVFKSIAGPFTGG
jgi:hypothetical protein